LVGRLEAKASETGGISARLAIDGATVRRRAEHGEPVRRISVHARLLDADRSEVGETFELVSFPAGDRLAGDLVHVLDLGTDPGAATLAVSAADVAGGAVGEWLVRLGDDPAGPARP
jgi:hypothetical protein